MRIDVKHGLVGKVQERRWVPEVSEVPDGSDRTIGGGTRSIGILYTFADLQQPSLTMDAAHILKEPIEKLSGTYERALVKARKLLPSVEDIKDVRRLQVWWNIHTEGRVRSCVLSQIDPC